MLPVLVRGIDVSLILPCSCLNVSPGWASDMAFT